MVASIWRWSHLALTLTSGCFILLLSLTGVILAVDPVLMQNQAPVLVTDFEDVSLAQTLAALQNKYLEVLDVSVNEHHILSAAVITEGGDMATIMIHPESGKALGEVPKQSNFMNFVTNFHRSLLLKTPGRILVAVNSALLLLLAVTGVSLLSKRQLGWKNLVKPITKDTWGQWLHTGIGRLAFVPIVIITITGVYLSFDRFSIFPEQKLNHTYPDNTKEFTEKPAVAQLPFFTATKTAQIKSVEFPFTPDPNEYFRVELHNQEVLIHQYTGEIVSTINYPTFQVLAQLSKALHTGEGNVLWALILGIASATIPLFMFTGLQITVRRTRTKIKNVYSQNEATHLVLVGSENGTTLTFAQQFHQLLLDHNISAHFTTLNQFKPGNGLKHVSVITATYGQGEAPTNATKFKDILSQIDPSLSFTFSVVGFGSLSYPAFCQFAIDSDRWLGDLPNSKRLISPHTIHEKSISAFTEWTTAWFSAQGIQLLKPAIFSGLKATTKLATLELCEKNSHNDTFTLAFKATSKHKIKAGDLLGIIPPKGTHERMYSIGFNQKNQLLLSVKLHKQGACSNFLNSIAIGQKIEARIEQNKAFRFPKKAKHIILIANGTGIAPFLGMPFENRKKIEASLYWGGKTQDAFQLYAPTLKEHLNSGKLTAIRTAFSQSDNTSKKYVQSLIQEDAEIIGKLLANNAVILICGSLAMLDGVKKELDVICQNQLNTTVQELENKRQIISDCY